MVVHMANEMLLLLQLRVLSAMSVCQSAVLMCIWTGVWGMTLLSPLAQSGDWHLSHEKLHCVAVQVTPEFISTLCPKKRPLFIFWITLSKIADFDDFWCVSSCVTTSCYLFNVNYTNFSVINNLFSTILRFKIWTGKLTYSFCYVNAHWLLDKFQWPIICLQCLDAAGWATGRASSL